VVSKVKNPTIDREEADREANKPENKAKVKSAGKRKGLGRPR